MVAQLYTHSAGNDGWASRYSQYAVDYSCQTQLGFAVYLAYACPSQHCQIGSYCRFLAAYALLWCDTWQAPSVACNGATATHIRISLRPVQWTDADYPAITSSTDLVGVLLARFLCQE